MGLCKDRAFELLKKISFERIAGTDKELECAQILEEECKKAPEVCPVCVHPKSYFEVRKENY